MLMRPVRTRLAVIEFETTNARAAVARTGNRDYADGQALATVVGQSNRHRIWRFGTEMSACQAGRVCPIGLMADVKGVAVSDLRSLVICEASSANGTDSSEYSARLGALAAF